MESFRESFPFRSLPAGTSLLRVVSVEPGGFDDPLRCKLQYVNLDQQPEYEALSYVWGDPNVTVPITLDGFLYPVTTNLHLALRYLRREDTERTFWIDAICINQTDIAERNEQVMRIRDIYEHAAKVIIWVGEDVISSAFGGSIRAGQLFAELERAARGEEQEGAVSPREWRCSLLDFVSRPWFRRMWIIQESVANIMAEITCGHASLHWFVFLLGTENSLPAMQWTVMASDIVQHKLENIATLMTCLNYYFKWKNTTLVPDEIAACIARLLFILAGKFQCTDSRDRLFAILGLIPGSSEALADAGLSVDYRSSAADVFRDLAVFLITRRRSLDILAAYGADWDESTTGSFAGKPSWVPTFDESQHRTLAPILLSRMDEDAYRDAPPAEFRFSEDRRTLFLRGAVLGEVVLLGDEITTGSLSGFQDPEPECIQFLTGFFRRLEHRILSSPVLKRRYRTSDEALEAWKHCLFHTGDDLQLTRHFCYDVLLGHIPMADIAEEKREAVRWEVSYFVRFTPFGLIHKYPFVVSSGDIGIAEAVPDLRVGDLVCIFLGCTIPCIIRPHGDMYTFVGMCYIYNLIDLQEQRQFLANKELREFAMV